MFLWSLLLLSLVFAAFFTVAGIDGSLNVTQLAFVFGTIIFAVVIEAEKLKRRLAAIESYLAIMGDATRKRLAPPPRLSCESSTQDVAATLEYHLSWITGKRHLKTSRTHHDYVKDAIADHLRQNGWCVTLEQVVGPYGTGENVIAEKLGTNPSPGILIVGAHYDTVRDTPGADDNGIAVAGMLALSEILSKCTFEGTVRLVAWDLEEHQSWGRSKLGSRVMARNCKKAKELVRGVICLEMIGACDVAPDTQKMVPGLRWVRPKLYEKLQSNDNRADFIAFVSNPEASQLSAALVRAAEQAGLPTMQFVNGGVLRFVKDLRRSDHARFWEAGYPAIMVTDTANFRTPLYHSRLDRPEAIDFEFASKVVHAVGISITEFAGGRWDASTASSDLLR